MEYVESLGWLGRDVWLAHGVHLDDAGDRAARRDRAPASPTARRPTPGSAPGIGRHARPPRRRRPRRAGRRRRRVATRRARSSRSCGTRCSSPARSADRRRSRSATGSALAHASAARGCSAGTTEIGSLEPGKLADVALWRVDTAAHAGHRRPRRRAGARPARRRWSCCWCRAVPSSADDAMVDGRRGTARGRRAHRVADAAGKGGGGDDRHEPRRAPGLDRRDRRRPRAASGSRRSARTAPSRSPASSRTPRPVDGRHAVGRHPAQPAPVRPGSWASTSPAALATPGCLRRPHPRGRARATKHYGLEHQDQPVLAIDVVRYQGEPVALVAADHPETARRAAKQIVVEYEVLEPVVDARAALRPDSPRAGAPAAATWCGTCQIRTRRPGTPTADVVVIRRLRGRACRTRPSSARSPGLAVPAEDGGVDLYVATQWLHVDQRQIAPRLGLPPDQVRLTLAGVGGAFGGREDLSMQVHALPARAAHRQAGEDGLQPRGVLLRPRAPAPGVDALRARRRPRRQARLRHARPIHLDGGAYASSTPAVVGNAATLGIGPYEVPARRTWTATAPTPTTRPAARCAASARSRPLRVRGA